MAAETKSRKIWELIPKFLEVQGGKTGSPILIRVKLETFVQNFVFKKQAYLNLE